MSKYESAKQTRPLSGLTHREGCHHGLGGTVPFDRRADRVRSLDLGNDVGPGDKKQIRAHHVVGGQFGMAAPARMHIVNAGARRGRKDVDLRACGEVGAVEWSWIQTQGVVGNLNAQAFGRQENGKNRNDVQEWDGGGGCRCGDGR